MIDLIVQKKGLTHLDARRLCSVAVDFRITQVIDGSKGVHGMLVEGDF
jgi:acetamidase/formamidase